jgi:LPS-assembly protein
LIRKLTRRIKSSDNYCGVTTHVVRLPVESLKVERKVFRLKTEMRQAIHIHKSPVFISIILGGLLLCLFNPQDSFGDKQYSKERFLGDDDTPWQITAKRLSYKEKEGLYVAEGDVVISKGEQLLYAQKVTYNTNTGIATVSEDVRFESGKDILTGSSGIFNLKNRTGTINNGSLFLSENNYHVSGEVMEKLSKDTYLVKKCRLTTCDGVKPAWSITGSEVKVTIEGYGTVKHAAFWVRGFPMFYIPYIIFPAKTKRQTGLLPPRVGYSSRNGVDTELPLFLVISDQVDATLYQRYMSERGYMQGVEFRYLADEKSKGIFLFDILSDNIKEKDMNDSDELEISPFTRTNQTRYWLRGMADQNLPLGFSARLDTDYVSDQDYFREFEGSFFGYQARPDLTQELGRSLEDRYSPTRRSALRVSKFGEGYSLQALGSYHQRPEDLVEDRTPQPAGGFDYMLLPDRFTDFPMFFSLETDYDYVWRDVGDNGHRASISPELRFPWWLGRYVEFEPSIRYTHTSQWIDDDIQVNEDYQDKGAYEAQGRLSTSIERVFNINGEKIKKVKHKVSPVLGYRYRNHLDEAQYRPWFEAIDDEDDINLAFFSLENYLDARLENKKGDVTYRQWATLTFTQGYDLHEARRNDIPGNDREPFVPLNGLLTVSPIKNIDLFCEAEWDHYDNEISFADVALTLSVERSGNKHDSLSIDYQYDKTGRKSLNLVANLNLISGFYVGGSLERDMEIDYNISNSYWVGYDSQCWGVRLIAARSVDETSVMVLFRLINIADIKTW